MKLKLFLILCGIFLGAGCGQNSDTGDVGTAEDPSKTMVVRVEAAMNSGGRSADDTVSYTHLTLPTILLV